MGCEFCTGNMGGGSQYMDNRQENSSFYCNIDLQVQGADFVHDHNFNGHHFDYNSGQSIGPRTDQMPLGYSTPTTSVADGSWGFGPPPPSLTGVEELAAAPRLHDGSRAARPLMAPISPLEELWMTYPHLAFTNQDFERLMAMAMTTNAGRRRATANSRTGSVRKRTARQGAVKDKERPKGQRQRRAPTFTLTGRTLHRVFDGQVSTSYRCSDGVVRILSGEALEAAKARTAAAAAAAPASASATPTMAAWGEVDEEAGARPLEEAMAVWDGMDGREMTAMTMAKTEGGWSGSGHGAPEWGDGHGE